ncbi:MAG: hypothetical protein QOK43_938 [Acidimicrobiaceae bacterium]|nr:hypothetical protein [Acidimicrobiaceae bacterium]
MDALQLITADHNRVRGLFAQFKSAHEAENTGGMASVATRIIEELQVHATIEEQVFYPWIQSTSDEARELVAEGIEEHNVVKTLMAEITALPPDAEEWTAKMQVLIENVDHHAEEEEDELFTMVRKATDAAAREEIGLRLEAAKRDLGAPTLDDKINLTKEELIDLAREQEIPGRSSMSQEELAATVAPR